MPSAPRNFTAPWSPPLTDEERQREYDKRRSIKKPWRGWYKTKLWRALRERRRLVEPLCRMCAAKGIVKAMEVVDHIVAHRGNRVLFYSFENTQSLCAACHNGDKQREEYAAAQLAENAPTAPIQPIF